MYRTRKEFMDYWEKCKVDGIKPTIEEFKFIEYSCNTGRMLALRKWLSKDEVVIIPEYVFTIDINAFKGTNIKILDMSYTKDFLNLNNEVFSGLSTLEEVILPNNLEVIGNNVFRGCTSLKKIILPDTVKEIRAGAFDDCGSLTEVIIGKNSSLRTIGTKAFRRTAIKSLDFNDNLYALHAYSFCDCHSLQEVRFGSGISNLNKSAFQYCDNLEVVDMQLSKHKVTMQDYCFYGCKNLRELKLPNRPIVINNYVFTKCEDIKLDTTNIKSTEYAKIMSERGQ